METALLTLLRSTPNLDGATVDWGSRPRSGEFPSVVLNVVSENSGHTHEGGNKLTTCRVQIDVYSDRSAQSKEIARAIKRYVDGHKDTVLSGVFFENSRDMNEEGKTSGERIFRTSQDFYVSFKDA